MAAVRADSKIRANLSDPVRRLRHHARDYTVLFYKINHLSLHHEAESGIAPRVLDNEVQEIPLRHERQEFAMCRQVTEVGNSHHFLADLSPQFQNFLVGPLQEILQNPQLIHEFKCGRMNGVSAEITQKVR